MLRNSEPQPKFTLSYKKKTCNNASVVVTSEYAIKALIELSDATCGNYTEDNCGAPRDGNNDFDQMFS